MKTDSTNKALSSSSAPRRVESFSPKQEVSHPIYRIFTYLSWWIAKTIITYLNWWIANFFFFFDNIELLRNIVINKKCFCLFGSTFYYWPVCTFNTLTWTEIIIALPNGISECSTGCTIFVIVKQCSRGLKNKRPVLLSYREPMALPKL